MCDTKNTHFFSFFKSISCEQTSNALRRSDSDPVHFYSQDPEPEPLPRVQAVGRMSEEEEDEDPLLIAAHAQVHGPIINKDTNS